jgi:hypothetical protein
LLAVTAIACGDDGGTSDAAVAIDAAVSIDAGFPDAAASVDAPVSIDASPAGDAPPTADAAGAIDAAPPDAVIPDAAAPDAVVPAACIDAGCIGLIVIGEFRTRGPGGASDEFVEIFNRSAMPVDVNGMELRYRSSSGTDSHRATVATSTVIPAGGFLLFANTAYAGTVDVPDQWSTGFSDTGGTVYLRVGGTDIVDLVGWGTAMQSNSETQSFNPGSSPCDVSCERKANAASTAASMSGGADELAGNSYDSNNNSADFVQRATSDPQTASSTVEP